MIDYSRILSIFYRGKAWVLNGETYEGLNWLDSDPKPTKEELDAKWIETKIVYNKSICKDKAKQLLAASDWTQAPDVNLINKSEFATYREKLRDLVFNPVENPVWPTEPEEKWG